MMVSSHSGESTGPGSSEEMEGGANHSDEDDEVELMEFFTFASDTDVRDEEFSRRDQGHATNEEEEVTQDPLPTVRPFLQFGWRLIKWPLAFFLVNMGVAVGLIMTANNVYYDSTSVAEDIVTLWQFQSFFLFFWTLLNALAIAFVASWLSPQIRSLQGHQDASSSDSNGTDNAADTQTNQLQISPHARSAHSLDIYLIKRNLRRRRRPSRQQGNGDNQTSGNSLSRGVIMNLLLGLAASFSLVALGSLIVFALSTSCKGSHKLDASTDAAATPTSGSASSSVENKIGDNLPEEHRDWFDRSNRYHFSGRYIEWRGRCEWARMVDGSWFVPENRDLSTFLHVLDGESAGKSVGPFDVLLRMDYQENPEKLPLNVSSICGFQYGGSLLLTSCYEPDAIDDQESSTNATNTTMEKFTMELTAGCGALYRIGVDLNGTLWILCEGHYRERKLRLYQFNMTEKTSLKAKLVATESSTQLYASEDFDIPSCLTPYRSGFLVFLSSLTVACGMALIRFTGASGAAFMAIGVDLLVQAASTTGAAYTSDILSYAFLALLLRGTEYPPYLGREQQCWGLYGLLSFAWIDFAWDWRLQPYFFFAFFPCVFIAQFFLNHPVLPLLASLLSIGTVLSLVFGIIYPPLLLLALYQAILSAGMFVVDHQWIRFRPYVIFYLQKCWVCCGSSCSSSLAAVSAATTPAARVAD